MGQNFSSYAIKLAQLRKELSDIHTNLREKKKSFNENQQKVYDFIIAKKDIIHFNIKGQQYFLTKGTEHKGFMHILLRHYGEGCAGRLSARNILNIATTLKLGSPYSSKKNDYLSISNTFNDERFIVVLSKDRNGHWVVTYYSVEEDEGGKNEVGQGDYS